MAKSKFLLLLAAALMLLAAYRMGLFGLFADPAETKDTLLRLGALGYVAFVAAFALLQPFGVPGVVFMVASSLVWPWPIAAALSLTGSTLASITGFSFARYIARDWVEKRIPPRLRKYDDKLAERGFVTVFVLRSIFWMQPMLHLFFGLSRVRFSTHLGASALAYVAPTLAVAYFGDAAFAVLREQPLERWIAAAAIAVVVASGWGLRAYRRRRASLVASPRLPEKVEESP